MSQKDFISFHMIHFIVFARKVKEMKAFTLGNAFFVGFWCAVFVVVDFNARQQPGDLGVTLRRIPGPTDGIKGALISSTLTGQH